MTTSDGSSQTLGDLVALKRGSTYQSKLLGLPGPVLLGLASIAPNGGFRWDSIKTYGGESDKRILVYPGDIYVSLKDVTQSGNLLGAVSRVPSGISLGRLTQDTVKLEFKDDGRHTDYVYWLLHTPQYRSYCRERAIGTTNLSLSRDDFLSFPVPLLTAHGEELATALDAIEQKIELNRQMNQTLMQIAAVLFKSWFIEFDPVRAKAAGRQPEGMDAETATLFPDRLVESEIGEIPDGWRQTTVSEVAKINSRTLGKNDPLETIEYVDISAVSRGDIAAIQVFKRGEEPSRARRKLQTGDTVLSTVRPDRGAYFLSLNPGPNLIASTGFAVVSPSDVPWSYLHSALTRDEVSTYLGHVADGGAYPAVRPEVIGSLSLTLPVDASPLNIFHAICGPLFERAALNRQESHSLAELRDTLLPRLLSSELRVPIDVLDEEAVQMQPESKDQLIQSRF